MSEVQNHQFTMDPNLLVSVIKSQAGTLSKAILEGVMNSIDAGASRVDVTVTETFFRIVDNGRGFTTEEEIRNWFGRFGTPHVEGDAIYGRFRMGRGQMMAFAATQWLSGPFKMTVDLEKRGLTYDLEHQAEPTKGCHITGTLYRELTDYKLRDVLTELKKFVAYTPKPVYVNGELYGAPASRLKTWTFEDDDAFYRVVQDSQELLVYNQGVFVEEQGTWRTGMGGVVVSKRPLEVNFARNSVMEDSCEVWRRITKKLERIVLAKLTDAKKLDDGERRFLARRLDLLSRLPGIDMLEAKVLTDPSGKHVGLGALRHYKRFVHIPEKGPLACAAHGEKGTFVVTDDILTRFGVDTLGELLSRFGRYHGILPSDYEVIDAKEVAHLGLGGAEQVGADGLTKKERAAFKALSWLNDKIAEQLMSVGAAGSTRTLLIGKHKTSSFVAWTDGSAFITANKRHLKLFDKGLNGVSEWALTLVHEYMHDTDDSESHSHGEVFYRKFHDTVFMNNCLNVAVLSKQGLSQYLRALNEEGLHKPRDLSKQLKAVED